ncbi:MAG: TRAP transporter small permease [Deltaproteobacteria bacterium]|nr:TRAP transporter small permease [Deltaproteobacteria bacterium]MBI3078013.1 TRAP transporter small permease [Deltaproteobacteria bacterium]
MRLLVRLDALLGRAEQGAMLLLMAAMTAITFLQVVARYLMHQPFFWTEELARFLFIWITMLGMAMGVRAGGHYGFDLLARAVPSGVQRGLAVVAGLVMAAVALVLTTGGWQEAMLARLQTASSLPLAMVWPYLALPVGGALSLVHLAALPFRREEAGPELPEAAGDVGAARGPGGRSGPSGPSEPAEPA